MQQTVRASARLPYARPGMGHLAPGFGGAFADLADAGLMLRDGAAGGAAGEEGAGPGDEREVAAAQGRVAVVVLGMHRSGTSAMARLLSLLGCALPATLMPARTGNEGGHWESEAICALNDALLDNAGSHWADWRVVAHDAGWMAGARQVLREEFGAADLFVMKDPRQCRLMPFWRDVLAAEGVAARVVLTLRHPWEVAQSLARRDGMGAARANLLWLGHMLGAEAGSRGMARTVCSYDALMAARGEEALGGLARDLAGRLGVVWPSLSSRTLGEVAAFLDPAARHHVAGDGTVSDGAVSGGALTGWAGRVHAILSGWAADGEQARDHAELDAIARALAQAGPDLARMLEENEALAGDLARERAEAGAALEGARGEVADARGALAGALEWLGAGQAELAQARARLVEMEGALAEREAALAMRDGVLALREAGLVELADVRDGLVAERVALFAQIAALEQARDEAGDWVLRLARERHGLERDVARGGRQLAAMARDLARGAAREERLGEAVEMMRAQAMAQERAGQAALGAMERAHALVQADLAQVLTEMAVMRDLAREVVPVENDEQAQREQAQREQALREQARRELAESDLAERYGEIAALTLMLREQVEAARRREGEAAWMRGLWAALERAPGWWGWVPGGLRRRLREGWLARRGVFDAGAYRAEHGDVVAAGLDPLDHFIRHGMGEGRVPLIGEG